MHKASNQLSTNNEVMNNTQRDMGNSGSLLQERGKLALSRRRRRLRARTT